jgi:hypothetical protein
MFGEGVVTSFSSEMLSLTHVWAHTQIGILVLILKFSEIKLEQQ